MCVCVCLCVCVSLPVSKGPGPASASLPFLVPLPVAAAASEMEKEPLLQVVWMLQWGNTIIVLVFSSPIHPEWRRIPMFCGWRREYPLFLLSYRLYIYAHGCFFGVVLVSESHCAQAQQARDEVLHHAAPKGHLRSPSAG